jgi:hypothetical protein
VRVRWFGLFVAAALLGLPAVAQPASSTRIVGGSVAQQVLLRQIVAGLGTTRIAELRVVTTHGGVKLRVQASGLRATWEALVVGSAFGDRSVAMHLPPLFEVDVGNIGWGPSTPGSRRPPRATTSAVGATERAIRRLVLASGGRVKELSVSTPDALAVAVRVGVDDAAVFLQDRLRAFAVSMRAHASRYDGTYIEVDDARGAAWTSAETRLGGIGKVRPSLSGCDPFPPPGPPPRHPPCPE